MRAYFEIGESSYPIGALRVGESYRVTDMLSLTPLHPNGVSRDEAANVAASVNYRIRKGDLPNDTDAPEVRDLVQALLEAL